MYTACEGFIDWLFDSGIHWFIKGVTSAGRYTLLLEVLLIDLFIHSLNAWLLLEDVDCLWGSCWSIDWLVHWFIKGVTLAGRCRLLLEVLLIYWLIDLLIHWFIKVVTFEGRCTLLVGVLLIYWLIDWLIDWLINSLKVWLWLEDVNCLWGSCWSIDWFIDSFIV